MTEDELLHEQLLHYLVAAKKSTMSDRMMILSIREMKGGDLMEGPHTSTIAAMDNMEPGDAIKMLVEVLASILYSAGKPKNMDNKLLSKAMATGIEVALNKIDHPECAAVSVVTYPQESEE